MFTYFFLLLLPEVEDDEKLEYRHHDQHDTKDEEDLQRCGGGGFGRLCADALQDEGDGEKRGDNESHSCRNSCVGNPVGCEVEDHQENDWDVCTVDEVKCLALEHERYFHYFPYLNS